jgi:hypothetical protein
MALGADPGAFIVYPGGNSFYLKEVLEETLRQKKATFTSDELERIFRPFLDHRIRRIVERFDSRKSTQYRWKNCSPQDLLKRHQELHPFDKRRLHYLRCGRVNMGNLDDRPWKFLNVLLEKSRDEIEHVLEEMEWELPPYEIRSYLYAALELQTHFRHLLIRHQPGVLDPEKVDHYFLEDLCRLNRDERFFKGVERSNPGDLHPYLKRYVILFFDNPFDPASFQRDYVEDFMGRHRSYRPHRSRSRMTAAEHEALKSLSISPEDFKEMDRYALVRHYRKQAKVVHPDKGGHQEDFVKITEAYECLLRLKG